MKQFICCAAIFAASASAIPVWGQCGGRDWTGSGTCDSGSSCVKVNDCMSSKMTAVVDMCLLGVDYSQCQPGGSTMTTTTRGTTATTPTTTKPTTTTNTRTTGGGTTTTTAGGGSSASGNPFAGKQGYANPYYASEVSSLAIPSLPSSLVAKASAVAKVPSFTWL